MTSLPEPPLLQLMDEFPRCRMWIPGKRVSFDMATPRPWWFRRFFWWALLGVTFEKT